MSDEITLPAMRLGPRSTLSDALSALAIRLAATKPTLDSSELAGISRLMATGSLGDSTIAELQSQIRRKPAILESAKQGLGMWFEYLSPSSGAAGNASRVDPVAVDRERTLSDPRSAYAALIMKMMGGDTGYDQVLGLPTLMKSLQGIDPRSTIQRDQGLSPAYLFPGVTWGYSGQGIPAGTGWNEDGSYHTSKQKRVKPK